VERSSGRENGRFRGAGEPASGWGNGDCCYLRRAELRHEASERVLQGRADVTTGLEVRLYQMYVL
jgi:hypothetical protein